MSRGVSGAVMRAVGARDHQATVREVQTISSTCLRIRFHSETLFDDVHYGAASWVRGWFPDGAGREFQRGYTFTEADPDSGEFALDFVLHEPSGPASRWAAGAEPGMTIDFVFMGSRPFEPAEHPPAGYLLIGDAAAIPAINSILAAVPGEIPVELYLEEHDPRDRGIPLGTHPRLRTRWIRRTGPSSLADALEVRDWSDWYAWATPESGSLKEVRKRLKEFGFPKSEIHAQAYWVQGKAMGKRRDPDAADAPAPDTPAADTPAADAQAADAQAADTPAGVPPAEAAGDGSPAPGRWRAGGAGRLLAPLRNVLIAAGLAQAVVTVLQLAPYVLLVELGRRLLSGAEPSALWTVGILAVILLAVGTLLETALLLWLHAVDSRFSRSLRGRLLAKLARLPLGWFDARGAGNIKTVVQDNTLSLHYLVTHAVLDAAAAAVAPLAVLVYLFTVDWALALFLLVPVLGYLFTMYRMVMQSQAEIPQAQRWADRMNAEAAEYLDAQPVIRVFGGAMASGFRRSLDAYIGFLHDWQWPLGRTKTVMDLTTRPTTFLWLIAAVGTWFIASGRLTVSDLLPFLLLGTMFGARLLGIGYGLSGLKTSLVAARDIQAVLDEPELASPDATATGEERPAGQDRPAGEVRYDAVTFGYRRGLPVIHDVSMTLDPGTVTALVGPSGSGKSTLAALLARFYDVGEGSITVGGRDIRTMEADELYRHVGFVLQDTQLVDATVADNIALADPGASRERIEQAAREARIHERITRMPDGYDTRLGPDAALSGGERQRLTIARALIADAPVLVLDEATAYADPESEHLVQRALARLARGRTVLVIAHRLHTIVDADRIVVLDHGRIVESGRHEELIALGGRYSALWAAADADHATTGALR